MQELTCHETRSTEAPNSLVLNCSDARLRLFLYNKGLTEVVRCLDFYFYVMH